MIFHIFLNIKDNKEKNYYKLYNIKKIKIIRIGIVAHSLKNGGIERQTSLFFHYFNKIKIFKLILFTIKIKQKGEYKIDSHIERIIIKNNLSKL